MKLKLLTLLLAANVMLFAQTTVENLSMSGSYKTDIYYSLDNGVVKSVDRDDWHIAFTTKVVDASIMTNTTEGINLYLGSSDISDWSTFDTTGMSWAPMHNSDITWTEGSFNYLGTTHPNYGWGTYNNTTHNVIGNKIFVLEFPDTTYKKIIIEAMKTTGDFEFKIANLDGSNEMSKVLNKGDYPNANFFYYNAKTDSAFSREPNNTAWDFVFTKFDSELSPGVWYPVTGALQNVGTEASEASMIDTNTVDWNNYPTTDTAKNIIGGAWKSYSFSPPPGMWVLDDSTAFFVKAQSGDLYKVVFKSWAGSTTGDFSFAKTLVSTIGLTENNIESITVYPNPSSDFIRFDNENNLDIQVYNLNGAVVLSSTIENGQEMNVSNLNPGTYILQAKDSNKTYVTKLVIL